MSDEGGLFPCRVYPHEAADGPGNMAFDEWMLESVVADPSAAALRTYAWSAPTLSLGYFQAVEEARADPRWEGAPVVRRPTGGGAIWHDREITYALVIPGTHPLARRAEYLYDAVHDALSALLGEHGLTAARRGPDDPRPAGPRPFLCFLDRDPADVVTAGRKLVGSAQRRRSGALLQHGSLLLSASPRAPELPGLAELAPGSTAPAAGEVASAILVAAGLGPVPASPDTRGRDRIERLAREIYRGESWMSRR